MTLPGLASSRTAESLFHVLAAAFGNSEREAKQAGVPGYRVCQLLVWRLLEALLQKLGSGMGGGGLGQPVVPTRLPAFSSQF